MTGILRALTVVALGSIAHAQLAAPFESSFFWQNDTNKWSDKALTADVTATARVRTSAGVLESSEHGKYWRNGKGMIRQDDQHGISIVLDLREPNRKTIIDSRLKVINVEEWPETMEKDWDGQTKTREQIELSRETDRPRESTPFGIYAGNLRRGDVVDEIEMLYERFSSLGPVQREQASLEGREVMVYKIPYDEGVLEWWLSRELKFVIVTRYVTQSAEFEQRYSNIRIEKQPDSRFQLPVEYPIRIVNGKPAADGSPKPCARGHRFTDGLTGQRSKKDGFARTRGMECLESKEPLDSPARVFPPAVPEQPETLPEHSGIRVHASVTMNRAHLASLRREDFVISEGRRQQQPIGALVQESLPVDLVIVLPRVWSELNVNINATIGQQLELAAQRVLRGLHPKDRVAVVSYGPEPRLEHSITQDREAIDGAIRRVRVAVQNAEVDEESLKLEKVLASLRVAIPPLWWTAINTKSLAIDYAQHVLQETPQENRRKVIFMVSDLFPGAEGDNYAGTPDEPVIQRLWDAGIVLSAMGLGRREPLRDHTRRQPVDATYRRNNPMHIAQATGGDALVVEDPAGLDDVLAHAREHYVLWFDQPEGLAPGQERTITVELSPDARKRFPDATVRARQGYITR